MEVKELALLGFQISLVCTVLSYGLNAAPADLMYLLRRPSLLARSLIAIVVVMPVVAVLMTRWLDFPLTAEVALIALAISPVPPRLPTRETRAGGHMPYALGLMVLLTLLSVAVVPLTAYLLGAMYGRSIDVPPADIALLIVKSVLVPLAAGMAIRAVSPGLAGRVVKPAAILARVLMPLAAIALLIVVAPALWPLTTNGSLLVIVAFLAIGFVTGHRLGGPEPEHAAVLAYATACRHPGIALATAVTAFPDGHFGATIVLYLVTAFVLGVAYRAWNRRRAARAGTDRRSPLDRGQ